MSKDSEGVVSSESSAASCRPAENSKPPKVKRPEGRIHGALWR